MDRCCRLNQFVKSDIFEVFFFFSLGDKALPHLSTISIHCTSVPLGHQLFFSLYDPVANDICVITFLGHLFATLQALGSWFLL